MALSLRVVRMRGWLMATRTMSGARDRKAASPLPTGSQCTPQSVLQARALESSHVERGAFLQAQTAGVERAEACAVVRQAHAAEKPAALCEAEDHRQRVLAWGAHTAQGGPVSGEGMFSLW